MDRGYYQLMVEANEVARMAIAVVQWADYKPCIKAVTDPIILDAIKEVQHTKRTLEEIMNRQEQASHCDKSK